MRILIYGDFYLSPTGFAREARDFAAVASRGHDLRQVALGCDGSQANAGGMLCYPTRGPGVTSHFAPEILDRAIDDFKPDVVLSIHDYSALRHIAPVFERRKIARPRWVHWGTLDAAPLGKDDLQSASGVDLHIAQSQFARKALLDGFSRHFDRHPPVECVYPGIDLRPFFRRPDCRSMREELGIDDRFVVVSVARNQFRKNLPALIEAVSQARSAIPEIMLCVHSIPTRRVDGAPDGYDLEALLDYFGLHDHMRLVQHEGPMDDVRINNFYNIGDLHCLPTMGEGFGLPLVEAMAAGLPNIATDCSSCTELLEDGRGILVKPAASIWVSRLSRHAVLAAEDLAGALLAIHRDDDLRRSIVQRSSLWAKQLDPEVITPQLLTLLQP